MSIFIAITSVVISEYIVCSSDKLPLISEYIYCNYQCGHLNNLKYGFSLASNVLSRVFWPFIEFVFEPDVLFSNLFTTVAKFLDDVCIAMHGSVSTYLTGIYKPCSDVKAFVAVVEINRLCVVRGLTTKKKSRWIMNVHTRISWDSWSEFTVLRSFAFSLGGEFAQPFYSNYKRVKGWMGV